MLWWNCFDANETVAWSSSSNLLHVLADTEDMCLMAPDVQGLCSALSLAADVGAAQQALHDVGREWYSVHLPWRQLRCLKKLVVGLGLGKGT